MDQKIDIGTDIASLFLFHPDDMKHRENDPLDWYTYDFACRKEFEAGNLVAFRTGSDGGYQVRVTDGGLTPQESAGATGSWEWGYTVQHGKVLIDNGDHLPSEEAFDLDDVPEEQWVELPNGNYRVQVHPIARQDDSLPDYVVLLHAVDQPLQIANSPSPPDLIPLKESPPKAVQGATADDIYEQDSDEQLKESYPFLVAKDQPLLPGGSISVPVSDALFEAVSNDDPRLTAEDSFIYVVTAPEEAIPGLATLAWVNGHSQLTGKPGRLSLQGRRLVRVTACEEGEPLPIARVEPVSRELSELDSATVDTLKAAFEKYAVSQDKVPSFERERIAAITKGKALTTRLIDLVPLPVGKRLELQGMSDADRARELIAALAAA